MTLGTMVILILGGSILFALGSLFMTNSEIDKKEAIYKEEYKKYLRGESNRYYEAFDEYIEALKKL